MEAAYLDMVRSLLNTQLTDQQKRRLKRLMSRDANEVKSEPDSKTEKTVILNPRVTAEFLSLFNKEQGFKYLTHDFVPGSDWDYERTVSVAKSALKEFDTRKIPESLNQVMRAFIYGKKGWIDGNNHKIENGYSSEQWKKWSDKTRKHPLHNPDFNEIIQNFRHTTRIVAPDLDNIIQELASKHKNLNVSIAKLTSMDFYTYVKVFRLIVDEILADISKRCGDNIANVSVVGKTKFERENVIYTITITHIDSFSSHKLDEAINRLKNNDNGGDFGSLRQLMSGYCHWSVESKWDGEPIRWNILKDDEIADTEQIDGAEGFSHILTFYKKN